MKNSFPKLIVITGPTATGKTRVAVKLAHLLKGEIISADSRQIYRGMDIGTGKDLDEYNDIPYHLIDILDPTTRTIDSLTHLDLPAGVDIEIES